MGVSASYGAGFVGMWLAVKGNVRSANAALTSFKDAMELAFKAGGVSGMFTVGLGLLGATIIFLVFRENAMKVLVGFGFGGSLAALFMRVGGGIYTKAADVGGDLVGKIEQDLPKTIRATPRRSPTTSATTSAIAPAWRPTCSSRTKSRWSRRSSSRPTRCRSRTFIAAYGAVRGRVRDEADHVRADPARRRRVLVDPRNHGGARAGRAQMRDPMRPINIGYMTSAIASVIGFFVVNYFYLDDPRTGATDWRFACCASLGIILAVVTLWLTNYFTHPDKRPGHRNRDGGAHRPGDADPVGHGRGPGVVGVGADGDRGARLSARWSFSTSRSRCSSTESR